MELKPPPKESEATLIALDFRTLKALIESIQTASATARAQGTLDRNEQGAPQTGFAGVMGSVAKTPEKSGGTWWQKALDEGNQR